MKKLFLIVAILFFSFSVTDAFAQHRPPKPVPHHHIAKKKYHKHGHNYKHFKRNAYYSRHYKSRQLALKRAHARRVAYARMHHLPPHPPLPPRP